MTTVTLQTSTIKVTLQAGDQIKAFLAPGVGPAGSPGPAGANGLSAYEMALANGFVGTEADWLASLVGPQGDNGANGADGVDGADGLDGASGQSAYELAVANGFVGTEVEWLASLIGQQGDAGPMGPQGIQGDAGPQGPAGATGPGVPSGGTTGQVLAKASSTDLDTVWVDLAAGGSDSASNAAIVIPRTGSYIGAITLFSNGATGNSVAHSLRLSGIRFANDVTVSTIGLRFNATAAGIYGRALVYVADEADPYVLHLVHSSGNMEAASGYLSETWNYTLLAGKTYFFGAVFDGVVNMGNSPGGNVSFGLSSATQTAALRCAVFGHTFADPNPANLDLRLASFSTVGAPMVPMQMVEA